MTPHQGTGMHQARKVTHQPAVEPYPTHRGMGEQTVCHSVSESGQDSDYCILSSMEQRGQMITENHMEEQ